MSTMAHINAMNAALHPHGVDNSFNPFYIDAQLPPPSDADLLWEKVRMQLTRYNRIIAIPILEWQAIVQAPDYVQQILTLKQNYHAYTLTKAMICELSDYPSWMFMLPKDLACQNEFVFQSAECDPAKVRMAYRPILMVDLHELENRSHGPFPQDGVLVSLDEKPEVQDGDCDHIPRPRNAWIIYRQSINKQLKDHPELAETMDMKGVSQYVSKAWESEPEGMKAFFKEIAAVEKLEHARRYPNYVYQPRKPSEKKKRMSKRKAKAEYEAAQNGPPLTTQEQERIHKNALKFGIIPAETPFVPQGMRVPTNKLFDFEAGMGMDSTMLQEPFFTDGLDFNNYGDGLFDGFAN